ncbi:KPN_02809 family neutral zinc metallopeptidase [Youngiibacter multivorans]|uniref:Metalloprotease n=1 Tax=Youngiibacter multivorans TaxID=937251 RepID=A0ABS4G2X3_9CLOT|nr:neutral zinc metallopeptidase [Youngiibacter multivorans]MBP1918889.1 putative metalloprotease [Youngiibacter multivorans]
MKWRDRSGSSNVGRSSGGTGGKIAAGGGIGMILLLIMTLLGGGDLGSLFQNSVIDPGTSPSVQWTAEEEEMADFFSVVLADTEVVWGDIFKASGREYVQPKMMIYSGSIQSACGVAGESTGPFYCPTDQTVYMDLTFYKDLRTKYNVPGDFAMAYVIAHEVGHHIQNLTGILDEMEKIRQQVSKTEYNEYSVKLELQADYLAGVWANHVQGKGYLEEGDIEEALNAANAIGDDTLQKQTMGYTVPDSFTHGTSEQRVNWFRKGYELGDLSGSDTFGADDL